MQREPSQRLRRGLVSATSCATWPARCPAACVTTPAQRLGICDEWQAAKTVERGSHNACAEAWYLRPGRPGRHGTASPVTTPAQRLGICDRPAGCRAGCRATVTTPAQRLGICDKASCDPRTLQKVMSQRLRRGLVSATWPRSPVWGRVRRSQRLRRGLVSATGQNPRWCRSATSHNACAEAWYLRQGRDGWATSLRHPRHNACAEAWYLRQPEARRLGSGHDRHNACAEAWYLRQSEKPIIELRPGESQRLRRGLVSATRSTHLAAHRRASQSQRLRRGLVSATTIQCCSGGGASSVTTPAQRLGICDARHLEVDRAVGT